eukprot:7385428-Prymnesium_polylepis.1
MVVASLVVLLPTALLTTRAVSAADKIVMVNASCTNGTTGCSGWCLENATAAYTSKCIAQGACSPEVCDPIAAVIWTHPVVLPAANSSCSSLGFTHRIFEPDAFFGSASTVAVSAPEGIGKTAWGFAQIAANPVSRAAGLDYGAKWRAANPQCDMHG